MNKIFEADIPIKVEDLLHQILDASSNYSEANQRISEVCGINFFFENSDEFNELKRTISYTENKVAEPDRAEYGDFQTNSVLAHAVTSYLKNTKKINPAIVIEPTCGKGNFIEAALTNFPSVEKIIGVEIFKPYLWHTKFKIIEFFITNPSANKPSIDLLHHNIFDFDFSKIAGESSQEILILGNPPWVTNAKLSVLDSQNLPKKSNFKGHSGMDAITGKGNFDIGEYISVMMIQAFQHCKGNIAFLVKNSVIKNLVFDQFRSKYRISTIEKFVIDSRKEFNVSVEASLLFCQLNDAPSLTCNEFDFYNPYKCKSSFGWVNDKFVSDTNFYLHYQNLDGICPFEWRQGIKHDNSSVMELERINNYFVNGLQEIVYLEENLVYGILKSSDLKQNVIEKPRKYTIITQQKVGQNTAYIKEQYPQTYSYLWKNRKSFDSRKSSIYKNKPPFSIFGIGSYSFSPYKIAISGLYKNLKFCLILPSNNKALMLDDTCYMLGFNNIDFAAFTYILLNSDASKNLLQSISFSDAKRMITKDILMRIDLKKLANSFDEKHLIEQIKYLDHSYGLQINHDKWKMYLHHLNQKKANAQMEIFSDTFFSE